MWIGRCWEPWRRLSGDWATNVLLVFESMLYMKSDEFIHEGSYIRLEQLVLTISRTRVGAQWWKYMYDVIGTDVAEHSSARIEEVGDSIRPWNELLPHFKFAGEKPRGAQPA